jgi:diguanylate cyclase (GGDEF)-like protein/PAS domain S-box-containing protein
MGTDAVVKVSYLVPLRPGPDGKPLGILDFHLDFQSILVSIRHDQPTFRASGETLLVCEVEGQMVFLSRTRLTTAPIFGEALTGKEQEEIQAYLSGAGSSDWVDYRGVPCIAAFRQLSTLPWTIFSKMDREEITVHLVRLAWADTAVDALFILIAGLLSYSWWRQKQTQQKADWEHVQRERDHLDQQLKTLSRYANDIVLRLDGNGKVLDANDRALAAYGYSHDEMFGLYIKDLMTVQALRDFFKRFQAEEYLDSIRFETTQVRKDGSSFPVEMSSRQFKQNGARYFQVIIRDITERKQAEEALRRSEAKFRGVVSQPLVGIAIIEDGRFNYTNPRFAEIFGHSHEEIRLMTMLDLTTETDRPLVAEQIRKRVSGEVEQVEYEFLGLRKDGSPVHLEASGCTLELDGKLLLISMVRDISERKVAEAKVLALQDLLREQATRDGLTGLYNRRFLDEAMERELVLARRNNEEVSVIMGDLDHFKVVNDQYGHLAGDEALRVFSAMIQQLSRKSDIYCRYGGEEFLLVLPGMAKGIAVERAELLRRQIEAAPIRFGDFAIPVTASFGVACFPKDGSSRTELIAAADSALYLAKADGRNQVRT